MKASFSFRLITLVIALQTVVLLFFALPRLKAQTNKSDTVWVLLNKQSFPSRPRTIQPGRPLSYKDIRTRFKGIPTDLDTFQVYALDFQPRQGAFQRFRSQEIDSSSYKKLIPRYQIDEKKLSTIPIKQQVHILSGKRKTEKLIICDTNNDNSFLDELPIIADFKQKNKKIDPDSVKGLEVNYEYFFQHKVQKKKVLLKIIPFDKAYQFNDSLQQELAIFLSVTEHSVGKITVDGKIYSIRLPFPQSIAGSDYSNADIFLFDSIGTVVPVKPSLKVGQSYNFSEKSRIRFDYISELGDSLRIIKSTRQVREIGYREGERVKSLDFRDISDRVFTQNQAKKIVVLDFWGTWCGPCIAGLPNLKKFYEKYQDKITLISVAYDKDIDKVKKFIRLVQH